MFTGTVVAIAVSCKKSPLPPAVLCSTSSKAHSQVNEYWLSQQVLHWDFWALPQQLVVMKIILLLLLLFQYLQLTVSQPTAFCRLAWKAAQDSNSDWLYEASGLALTRAGQRALLQAGLPQALLQQLQQLPVQVLDDDSEAVRHEKQTLALHRCQVRQQIACIMLLQQSTTTEAKKLTGEKERHAA